MSMKGQLSSKTAMFAAFALAFVQAAPAVFAADADGAHLIDQNGCIACHATKDMEQRIGPPFPAVALRYAGSDDATVARLADKVMHGGAGAWGVVPMVAHPKVSVDEAKAMVRWVLVQNAAKPGSETK